MAELGAIASVVQLADIALRTSGEVCKFLGAYKSTDRDVKVLRDGKFYPILHSKIVPTIPVLRDVESNVQNLRRYVIQFRKSKNAIDEFENLSETIIGALQGYDDDMLAAKRLLPDKPMEKFKEKVHWVLKKREAQELVERVAHRNSSLATALEITGKQVAFCFPQSLLTI